LRTFAVLTALLMTIAGPAIAAAESTIDASLIPDGTYTVKVEKVLDDKHVLVQMSNGVSTTLTAGRPTINFSRVKPNDQLKLSIEKGNVLVYLDLTSH
jgi:hypothetical protein